jgi:ribose-phosphate pyrophosphokinase
MSDENLNFVFIQPQPKIYICSESKLKTESVKSILENFPQHNSNFHNIIKLAIGKENETDSDSDENNCDKNFMHELSQPINEGTSACCFERIAKGLQLLRNQKITLTYSDLFIAIENGIYIQELTNQIHDVCVVMICRFNLDGSVMNIIRHNSFGIEIDPNIFKIYLDTIDPSTKITLNDNNPIMIDNNPTFYNNTVFCHEGEIIGFMDNTYGYFLEKLFHVPHDNWMADPRFGNIDRRVQINDALEKFIIDINTDIIPNYPKPGIMFKDMTSITINHTLLNIMYVLLEKMITNNFDLTQIDYFAGLDSRGFYFAPILARIFKKGFIPVRKANKIPKDEAIKIASASYDTEYSTDEFSLHYRSEYCMNTGISQRNKTVLILDDLLATGSSIIGASKVLKNVGLDVIGAVTIYDVPALRSTSKEKLNNNNIPYKVIISDNSFPNDYAKLSYVIPDVMFKRIHYMLQEAKTPETVRKYTLTPTEWMKYEGMTYNQIKKIDASKMENVRMIYTEKDMNLAVKILDVLRQQTNADLRTLNNLLRANITNEQFSNGETRVKIDANIRDKHIIIVSQIRTGNINNDLIELLLIIDACNRANAEKVTVVMPYYPYSRSDKKDDPRCPIGAAVIANLLKSLDVHNLISVDLHAGQIQGYLNKGFHNLYVKKYLCEHIYKKYLRFTPKNEWNNKYVLIAPDSGSAKAIKDYSKILGINNIILDKQRDYSKPGTVMNSRMIGSREDLEGKTGIIIDDIADTMGTMCSAAKELVENGVKDVIVCVTHGVLSGEAIKRINETCYIKEVTVTDSLPQDDNVTKCPKLLVLSISELIARAIDGIISGRSISRLF